MTILILGATGMLGQALMAEGRARGFKMTGAARVGADYTVDIRDKEKLIACLEDCQPDLVINAAAITDLKVCESDETLAYEVNTRPAWVIAEHIQKMEHRPHFVQISTDHYYTSGTLHTEVDPVQLVNAYAHSKHLAEQCTLPFSRTLVVRTNIVGIRGHGMPTFAEWAMDAIENDAPITLFDDFFTSSIDVWRFSAVLFDYLEQCPTGLINIASRQVASKKEFIEALADKMGMPVTQAVRGSVHSAGVPRATHLGLDVSRIENALNRRMPDLDEVVSALVERRNSWHSTNPYQSMAG